MAYILWNKGEESLINTWLGGYNGTNNSLAAGASVWVGMGAKTGGVGTNKATANGSSTSTQLAEIGQTTAAGYVRQELERGATGDWPASSLSAGSHQSTASQVTFTFTGTPNLNGATLWFVASGAGTPGSYTDNCLFGADLAATRNFSNGDTERITITYRQT